MTIGNMSGRMSDMKKVNAREFQKAFSKVAQELGDGETVEVTRRGRSLGFFTKGSVRAAARRIHLVIPADRAFGTGLDTGVATHAQLEVDGIALLPDDIEGAEVAAQLDFRA